MPVDQPPSLNIQGTTSGSYILNFQKVPNIIQFYGPDNTVWLELNFDANPPTVNLHGHTPDEAAKVFWNRTASLVNQKSLFPDVK